MPKRYHHGSLKQALVDKAIEIIADEGHEAVSLRRLCRELEVSEPAVYRHYDGHAELISAVFSHITYLSAQYVKERSSTDPASQPSGHEHSDTPTAALTSLVALALDFAIEQPRLMAFLLIDVQVDFDRATPLDFRDLDLSYDGFYDLLLHHTYEAYQPHYPGELDFEVFAVEFFPVWAQMVGLAYLLTTGGLKDLPISTKRELVRDGLLTIAQGCHSMLQQRAHDHESTASSEVGKHGLDGSAAAGLSEGQS